MSETHAAVRHEVLREGEGPPMGAFARALRGGQGAPLAFLEAPPADEAGWRARLERAARDAPAFSRAGAERLARRQRELGAGPRAEAHARRLGEGALAVVTGQQPGLLGGPLLTFHKAAGALSLARRLDGLGGHAVVPVFWLASEDHDLDEANRAVVLDRGGQARRLRLPLEADGRSLRDVEVTPDLADALLAELRAALPASERGAAAGDLARPEPGEDLATWCARCLLRVLGDSGLVLLEPEQLGPEVGATYAWLLEHAETIQREVSACGAALRAAGLPAPLEPGPGSVPLFLRDAPGARRLRVDLDGRGGVTLRGEPSAWSRAALAAHLDARPELGSGNVAGRVFVQNRHLPVLAYVAGPTEIAYQAQLRAAHEHLGLPFPLAVPRPAATWIDARGDAVLAAFGADLGAVLAGQDRPPEAADAVAGRGLDDLAAALRGLDARVTSLLERGGRGPEALRRALDRVRQAWAKAEPAVRAAFAADEGVGAARWARLLDLVRPQGRPQERLLSPLSLVARHGADALRQGFACLDPLPAVHHLLHLAG